MAREFQNGKQLLRLRLQQLRLADHLSYVIGTPAPTSTFQSNWEHVADGLDPKARLGDSVLQ